MKFKPGDKILILNKTIGSNLKDLNHIKKNEIYTIETIKRKGNRYFISFEESVFRYFFIKSNIMKVEEIEFIKENEVMI